jgi:hypothetical protein
MVEEGRCQVSHSALALLLAERDDSTKADAIEVILDALIVADALDSYQFQRSTRPLVTLDVMLSDLVTAYKEEAAKLLESDADWEQRVDELEEEIKQLRATNHAQQIADLEERLRATEQRLAATAILIEDYSDALATARKFVTTCERAGLKTRHVRIAKKKV